MEVITLQAIIFSAIHQNRCYSSATFKTEMSKEFADN